MKKVMFILVVAVCLVLGVVIGHSGYGKNVKDKVFNSLSELNQKRIETNARKKELDEQASIIVNSISRQNVKYNYVLKQGLIDTPVSITLFRTEDILRIVLNVDEQAYVSKHWDINHFSKRNARTLDYVIVGDSVYKNSSGLEKDFSKLQTKYELVLACIFESYKQELNILTAEPEIANALLEKIDCEKISSEDKEISSGLILNEDTSNNSVKISSVFRVFVFILGCIFALFAFVGLGASIAEGEPRVLPLVLLVGFFSWVLITSALC